MLMSQDQDLDSMLVAAVDSILAPAYPQVLMQHRNNNRRTPVRPARGAIAAAIALILSAGIAYAAPRIWQATSLYLNAHNNLSLQMHDVRIQAQSAKCKPDGTCTFATGDGTPPSQKFDEMIATMKRTAPFHVVLPAGLPKGATLGMLAKVGPQSYFLSYGTPNKKSISFILRSTSISAQSPTGSDAAISIQPSVAGQSLVQTWTIGDERVTLFGHALSTSDVASIKAAMR
jgi:hypothetical protein